MARHRTSSKSARKRPVAAKMTRHATRSRTPFITWRWPKPDAMVLALLGLSLALRLWGIADRLPDPSYGTDVFNDSVVEETDRTTIGHAFRMLRGQFLPADLNPHTAGWPGLSFYTSLAILMAYRVVRFLVNHEATDVAFMGGAQIFPDQLFLF